MGQNFFLIKIMLIIYNLKQKKFAEKILFKSSVVLYIYRFLKLNYLK